MLFQTMFQEKLKLKHHGILGENKKNLFPVFFLIIV